MSAVMWFGPARVDVTAFGSGRGAPLETEQPTDSASTRAPSVDSAPVDSAPVDSAPVDFAPAAERAASSADSIAAGPTSHPAAAPAPAAETAPQVVRRAPPRQVSLGTAGAVIPLTPVGVLPGGELQLPDDPAWGGWWAGGSLPGDPVGPVVLAGHVDARSSGPGAFAALLDVAAGQPVDVVLSDGSTVTYTVTSREEQSKAALPAGIFATTGDARLVLVTCGGEFDPVSRHYADNVIVTAVPL